MSSEPTHGKIEVEFVEPTTSKFFDVLKPVAEQQGLSVEPPQKRIKLAFTEAEQEESQPREHRARTIKRPRVDKTTTANVQSRLRQVAVSALSQNRKDRLKADGTRSLRFRTLNSRRRDGADAKAANRDAMLGLERPAKGKGHSREAKNDSVDLG